MGLISFSNTILGYDNFVALENFNLEVERGEIITFFGPSGSGKSTIIKAILGIISPLQGTVKINGVIAHDSTTKIAYVPQDNQLLPWLTVQGNIDLWQKESKQNHFSTKQLLELVRLSNRDSFLPSELSGGMARRAALARGLSLNSEILCLDEAMVGVERSFRKDLLIAIRNHLKINNVTTIMISHDFEEAVFMSDKIYVLSPSPAEIINIINTYDCGMPETRDLSVFDSEPFSKTTHHLVN